MNVKALWGGIAASLGFLSLVFSAPLQAATPKEVAAGQHLASQYCARCHVVAANGQGGWTDAPSFPSIAGRPGITANQLSAIIQKPHMHMLYTGRPPRESDELAAYIMSLKQ